MSDRAPTPGKKAKRNVDDPPVDPCFEGQRFKVGELIYANYAGGKQWFEAKVLKVEKRGGLIYFLLHYQGWTDKFNDWRPYHNDNELHKHNAEGKQLMEEAKLKMKEANNKRREEAMQKLPRAFKKIDAGEAAAMRASRPPAPTSSTSCVYCVEDQQECDRKLPKCTRCKRKGTACNYPKALARGEVPEDDEAGAEAAPVDLNERGEDDKIVFSLGSAPTSAPQHGPTAAAASSSAAAAAASSDASTAAAASSAATSAPAASSQPSSAPVAAASSAPFAKAAAPFSMSFARPSLLSAFGGGGGNATTDESKSGASDAGTKRKAPAGGSVSTLDALMAENERTKAQEQALKKQKADATPAPAPAAASSSASAVAATDASAPARAAAPALAVAAAASSPSLSSSIASSAQRKLATGPVVFKPDVAASSSAVPVPRVASAHAPVQSIAASAASSSSAAATAGLTPVRSRAGHELARLDTADPDRAQISAPAPVAPASGAAALVAAPTLPPTLLAAAPSPMCDVAADAVLHSSVVQAAAPTAAFSSSPAIGAAAAAFARSNDTEEYFPLECRDRRGRGRPRKTTAISLSSSPAPSDAASSSSAAASAATFAAAASSSLPSSAVAASTVPSASVRLRSLIADMEAGAAALEQQDSMQWRIAMLEHENQRLAALSAQSQNELHTARRKAETALAQLSASQQRVSQLERELAASNQRLIAQADLSREQVKTLKAVKKEKLDALEDAAIAVHGKRKAEGDMQSEVEKRQHAEAAAASSAASSSAAAAQVDLLRADLAHLENDSLECPVCMDLKNPPLVVFAGCVHRVCVGCNEKLLRQGDLACPECRAIVPDDEKSRLRLRK